MSRTAWLLVLCGIVVVFLCGFFLWRCFWNYESTDDAQVDAHVYPVSARISGRLVRVNVRDNEYVHKGTVLAEIDPKHYQLAVEQARADLEKAVAAAESSHLEIPMATQNISIRLQTAAADVERAHEGVIAAETQLAAAKAQVEEAEANDSRSKQDVLQYRMLLDRNEVARQTYETILATARANSVAAGSAHANLEAAQQIVEQARKTLESARALHRAAQTAPEQIAFMRARELSARATVELSRAALEQAELNLSYTKITAPVSGQVNNTVATGINIEPRQKLLAIVHLQDVWITANFKETQLRFIRPGLRAECTVDTKGRTYRGHVDSIAPVSSFSPGNTMRNSVRTMQSFPVKIILEEGQNSDLQLLPGMHVVPKIYIR